MPSNTKYKPGSINQYSAEDLNVAYIGKKFICDKNTVTNCDFLITDDSLIDGGRVIGKNMVMGDKITCQVIDKDNVMGFGANVVLKQFVTDWYLPSGETIAWDFSANYPAKLYAGLYLRVIYTSVGTLVDVEFAINYKLHKILW